MDNLKHSEPSYVYKDSGWVTMLIASLIGIGGLIYVFEGMYKDGIDNVFSGTILEIFIGFAALIGWFFMMLSGLSSVFPIYIDSQGGYYRTLFLMKKNLNWHDVSDIAILKGMRGGRVRYNTIVCSRNPSKLVWSISVSEYDNYQELYQVVDYYVQKYEIKVTLESTLDGSFQLLNGMPQKLDFS